MGGKVLDYYPVGFGKLKSDILEVKGLCTGCSICTVMCRLENIIFDERPVMKQECAGCQLCSIACPRAGETSRILQEEWDILNRHAWTRGYTMPDTCPKESANVWGEWSGSGTIRFY